MKCLTPKCKRDADVRGLCNACYSVAKRLRDLGKFTFQELVDLGLMLPSKRRGCVSLLEEAVNASRNTKKGRRKIS